MKLVRLLSVINVGVGLSSSEEIKQACKLIICAQDLTGAEIDTIKAAYLKGPLYDGDVPSKSARDELVSSGFMEKVIVRGEEGFNACTYKGAELFRLLSVKEQE